MSSFQLEYEEGHDTLTDAGVVFFKFFSLLSVRIHGEDDISVRFGRNILDDTVSLDTAQKLKAFLKEQKEWIRGQGKRVSLLEVKRRMWWLVEKILELGIFTTSEQKHIMIWLDICLDQCELGQSRST
jgi:hypothetical protein